MYHTLPPFHRLEDTSLSTWYCSQCRHLTNAITAHVKFQCCHRRRLRRGLWGLSPVSTQTQSLALHKRKPQKTQALAFLAVFVYETHATQAIAYEWKPGLRLLILLISTPIKPQNPNANLCWPRVLTVPTKIEAVCMYVCIVLSS